MSATLSGLIVLENARPIDGAPLSVMFDGQMWLGEGRVLTGIFHYFNSSKLSFPEVGNYFAWIHVAKFAPLVVRAQPVNEGAGPRPETERQQPEERRGDEEVATANDGSTSSDALEESDDIVHVVGDIVQLIPTTTDDMRQQAYINVSGSAVNPNTNDCSFEVNAAQYTSHYKNNRPLSVLPVRAHFNLNKYRDNVPVPFDNTIVSVDGNLADIETDTAGHATRFHMLVENISFLDSKAPPSPLKAGGLGPSTPRSSRFKFDYGTRTPSSSAQVPALFASAIPGSSEPETPTRVAKRKA